MVVGGREGDTIGRANGSIGNQTTGQGGQGDIRGGGGQGGIHRQGLTGGKTNTGLPLMLDDGLTRMLVPAVNAMVPAELGD